MMHFTRILAAHPIVQTLYENFAKSNLQLSVKGLLGFYLIEGLKTTCSRTGTFHTVFESLLLKFSI